MPVFMKSNREELERLIDEEIRMVDKKAREVAGVHWAEAEQKVADELGYNDTLCQIEHIQNEIAGLQVELSRLEGTMVEKARPAGRLDFESCGMEISFDHNGRPYSIPTVFGREIKSVWDTLVLKRLNKTVSFFKIYSSIGVLKHAIRRELLLAGTFEDARGVYVRFYSKVVEAIGDDLPGLLKDVNAIPRLKSLDKGDSK